MIRHQLLVAVMKIFVKYLPFCFLVLSACSTVSEPYHPVILEQGVDMQKFRVDRNTCERAVTEKPSNLESTNNIRFRECLIGKGYKLLS